MLILLNQCGTSAAVGDNRSMATEISPPRTSVAVASVWGVSLLAGLAVVFFAPEQQTTLYFLVAASLSIVLSFAVQIPFGIARRFVIRVAAGALGSLLILGLTSAVASAVSFFTNF